MNNKQKAIILAVLICSGAWIWSPHIMADERGSFYVIGTGPAGPEMATLQALNTIKQVDVIVASNEHVRLFEDYVGDKPVLFDPWQGLYDYKGKFWRSLNKEEMPEFFRERAALITERVEKIKRFITEGRNVGLLDNGNPCLFAPSHWYAEHFDPQDLVIIPGMGSDAAAMAALGKSVIPAHDTRFVILTSPAYLVNPRIRDFQILKDVSKHPTTLILYMALEAPERLFNTLAQIYPPDMPCAVVYWAGYPNRQRIVRGTVADMGKKLSDMEEKYMGLLLIGRFLEGNPYQSAMSRPRDKK
jgi:precorrin-4 methylase